MNIFKELYDGYQCKVKIGRTETTQFNVTSGVRQGCILSPFLFLIVIDYIMKKATKDSRTGLQWSLLEQLEHLDFADDVCAISQNRDSLQKKTDPICNIAKQIGLKINANKTKVMMVNPKTEGAIHIDDVDLESVIDFNYLGSTISADGNIVVEIKQRIGKANTAYNTLQNIWRSKIYSTKTKIRIYKSCVRTVLLYGAETWKTDKRIESMLRGFEGRLLRRMLGFTWEDKISNIR
jgi:hypothetical protein